MIKEWLNWINASVVVVSLLLLLAGAYTLLTLKDIFPILEVAAVKAAPPEVSFQQPKESYDAVDEPVFHLKANSIKVQLPDLRTALSYYGKNNRPDADPSQAQLHFALTGEKTLTSFLPNQRIYLIFDRRLTPPRYTFSPHNAETPLWIEVSPSGSQVSVKVRLRDEKGDFIQEPLANAQFMLSEKPMTGITVAPWEIGKQRVDGTLLARQKARWFGVDRFLEKHGGAEYQYAVDKQRLDFGEGPDSYSLFVDKNSVIVWDGSRWKIATPGAETIGRPMLLVKKIDEKLMNFELWDPDGKNKIVLNLLKSNEPTIPPNLMNSFHFLGAKTLSQFLFEVNKERMTLSPQDWLLFIDKNWHKLSTPEEIDAYVDRKTPGYLFVFDRVERRDDRQMMVGTLFNRARTEALNIELVMQQGGSGMQPFSRPDEGTRPKEGASLEKGNEVTHLRGRPLNPKGIDETYVDSSKQKKNYPRKGQVDIEEDDDDED